jgi:Rod binding domain-containing protein
MAQELSPAVARPSRIDSTPQATAGPSRLRVDLAKTGKDFEAVFLRQALESILPHAKSGAFGAGTAASMWRSMLAEQMSVVLAERSPLGLQGIIQAKDTTE